MPKHEIDYSNTIIYKITCKTSAVTDLYVGHTTNFVQRKHAHKQNCINSKMANYHCKVYEVIRANGGWSNWSMEILNFYKCQDHYEARIKEHEYIVSLKANLSSLEPLPKPKANVDIIPNPTASEIPSEIPSEIENPNPNQFTCKCGKKYKHLSSLCAHKKKCTPNASATETEQKDKFIELLIKDNADFTPSHFSSAWLLLPLLPIKADKVSDVILQKCKNLVLEMLKSNGELQNHILDICKQLPPIDV